jgi:hypothetical protein
MAAARRKLILSPLAGLALWAVLLVSYLGDVEPCDSEAFWTSGWFFLPPLLALPGFFARRPYAAGSIIASLALLALWGLSFMIWFAVAISCGAG